MSAGTVPVSRQTLRRCIRSAKDLLTPKVYRRSVSTSFRPVGVGRADPGTYVEQIDSFAGTPIAP
jgi:hypothetical protein